MKYFCSALLLLLVLAGTSLAASTHKVTEVVTKRDWGSIPTQLSALVAILALAVAIATIVTKRIGDLRADRLNRVNRQLSQLYGKLLIINEAGEKNWQAFVYKHSNDTSAIGREFMRFFPYKEKLDEPITLFNPADPSENQMREYRLWFRALFVKTNDAMLETIYDNADLVIGQEMPRVFVSFAEHVNSLKVLLIKIDEEEKIEKDKNTKSNFLGNWKDYTNLMAPHPSGSMSHYISAAYEVLKEVQEILLSKYKQPPTEKELADKIKWRQWEKEEFWCKREHEVRAAAGQHYEYKSVPKPNTDIGN